MREVDHGCLILLNGPSSAGKSTLVRQIQQQIDQPFLQFSLDFFMFQTEVLPRSRFGEEGFAWQEMRHKVFEGYYNCLPALLQAGNNLVVDYIVENAAQLEGLITRLHRFDVFYVGVHCPLEELERREIQRGDRRIGDARRDLETVHSFSPYDFEVDSTLSPEENARKIISAWKQRGKTPVFSQLAVQF